jgi:hypothetical protein
MKKKFYERDGGRIIVSRVHEEYIIFSIKKCIFLLHNKPEIKPYPTWSTAILPALKTPLCCFWH